MLRVAVNSADAFRKKPEQPLERRYYIILTNINIDRETENQLNFNLDITFEMMFIQKKP